MREIRQKMGKNLETKLTDRVKKVDTNLTDRSLKVSTVGKCQKVSPFFIVPEICGEEYGEEN